MTSHGVMNFVLEPGVSIAAKINFLHRRNLVSFTHIILLSLIKRVQKVLYNLNRNDCARIFLRDCVI